ncbi:hypothetical protein C0993_002985 [Termitomyces sp. T159_Od127]|nr:hypothetical protein C0993_002985 [Termitomyces sp. T159_Od127]
MTEKLWEAPVPISTKELLTVAPGLREAMVQKLVPKPPEPKEPDIPRTATQNMVAVEKEPNKVDIGYLPGATYFIADVTQAGLPTGAVVHQDCVATYLEKIPPGEKPVVVYVARELQVLHLLNPIINRKDSKSNLGRWISNCLHGIERSFEARIDLTIQTGWLK